PVVRTAGGIARLPGSACRKSEPAAPGGQAPCSRGFRELGARVLNKSRRSPILPRFDNSTGRHTADSGGETQKRPADAGPLAAKGITGFALSGCVPRLRQCAADALAGLDHPVSLGFRGGVLTVVAVADALQELGELHRLRVGESDFDLDGLHV